MHVVPTVVDICPPKSECLAGCATVQGKAVSLGKLEKGSSITKKFFEAAAEAECRYFQKNSIESMRSSDPELHFRLGSTRAITPSKCSRCSHRTTRTRSSLASIQIAFCPPPSAKMLDSGADAASLPPELSHHRNP